MNVKALILKAMEKEYIEKGFMYSGCMSIHELREIAGERVFDVVSEMMKEGLIERRNCEALAYELPKEKRKQLILEHNLAQVWEEKAPFFYPNAPYGEVAEVFDLTQELLRKQALNSLHAFTHGYFRLYKSKGSNKMYETRYWTEDNRQFKKGQRTCNCPAWIYRRNCKHSQDMAETVAQAFGENPPHPNPTTQAKLFPYLLR